jgi:hypothetical protein
MPEDNSTEEEWDSTPKEETPKKETPKDSDDVNERRAKERGYK